MSRQEVVQTQTQTQTLPRPQHILASQAPPILCLACGKTGCVLLSHKHYSKRALATLKTKHKLPMEKTTTLTALPDPRSEAVADRLVQYPIDMDAERQHLLALWSQEWAAVNQGPERHMFPTRFIDKILPIAITHAPLFQALLAVSATLWSIAHSTLDGVAPRQLQSAAQMLSQASSTEQAASSDESMLAAILIVLVYLAQGNGFEVERHFQGLVHLAALRGGPHYLGMSGIVAEALMHADHMHALFFDTEPVWKLPLPALEVGVTPILGQGFRLLMHSNELDLDLLLAANSLGRVTDIFEQATTTTVPAEAMNALGYLSTISEYQLARCNAMYHQASSWNECVCLALTLFNLLVLRNDGAITPGVRKIEYRFWTALDTAETSGLLQSIPPCLLLWMLITGLTVSIRGDCQWRPLAIEKMRAAKIQAAIHGWDHFKTSVLDAFVWFRAAQEDGFRRIWLEVEGLKTMVKPDST